MKTNYFMSKVNKTFVLAAVTVALISGCGKDDKNVTSGNRSLSNGPLINNPSVFSNSTQSGYVSGLYNQAPCNFPGQDGQRTEVQLQLQAAGSQGGAIYGQLMPGYGGGSPSGAVFTGVHPSTHSIVVVTQLSSGGFNVSLSLCNERNVYNGNEYYIGGNAQLGNFMLNGPIYLSQQFCAGGVGVASGTIVFTSSTFGQIGMNFSGTSCQ